MARHDGGVQPQPGHALQRLVRDGDTRDRTVAALDARPHPPTGGIHRRADPGSGALAAGRDLIQRPPAGRHRRHQAEQPALIGHHPEIADHLSAISDRACQIRHHLAPVMNQQPPRRQRP